MAALASVSSSPRIERLENKVAGSALDRLEDCCARIADGDHQDARSGQDRLEFDEYIEANIQTIIQTIIQTARRNPGITKCGRSRPAFQIARMLAYAGTFRRLRGRYVAVAPIVPAPMEPTSMRRHTCNSLPLCYLKLCQGSLMLTATYSIVVLSAEQQKARRVLARLQQSISHVWKNLQEIDLASVEAVIHKLTQFDRLFHSRKMEQYVIPAIKSATREADLLLDELEALSSFCLKIVQTLPQQVLLAFQQGVARQKELRRAMELYCSNLQLRLMKEEQELLPLVPRVLSGDAIFELGAQFLSDDGKLLKQDTD